MDLPLLVLPRTSSWLHPLKHTKFLPWKFSFPAVLVTVREVSLPTFFLRIHCSHLFLSYLNTMGLMIFKSSHVLIFFLLLARISFAPACYPDSLHPYIATENSFFYERSCLTLCLVSPSKCPSPVFSLCLSWMHQQFHLGRCLISWKDAGSAVRDLSLPSNIAPSLRSKYSLISRAALFSSMIFLGPSLVSGTGRIF